MGTGIHCKPILILLVKIKLENAMKKITVLGFGNVGKNLATLFTDAGYEVTICSNDGSAGAQMYATSKISEGFANTDALALAIPYVAVEQILAEYKDQLAGKIIIDCTNPLNDDWSPLLLGQETSAAEQIASMAPAAKVVKAFNTIFADVMAKEHHDRGGLTMTAFVAGDDITAKNEVLSLAQKAGLAPLDSGALSSARYLEAMAHLNIRIAVELEGGTQAAFVYHQSDR